jgi:RNA polymerase sigma-70 factor (ECF subfamily)
MNARRDKKMELALDLPAQPAKRDVSPVPAEQCSDGELLRRIGEGDREAFDALYSRFVRPVFALALRRLRDRGRAEDATQETFASVWRSAKSYRPERGPGAPWLYAVARNAIVDRTRVRSEPATDPPEEASSEPGPSEQVERSWLAWRVHGALQGLPEHERSLLELAYWGGLSQSEIAGFLNIPLGTVKTRTRSALSHLADVLEEVK